MGHGFNPRGTSEVRRGLAWNKPDHGRKEEGDSET